MPTSVLLRFFPGADILPWLSEKGSFQGGGQFQALQPKRKSSEASLPRKAARRKQCLVFSYFEARRKKICFQVSARR